MFVKFFSPLTRELETTKPSLIELCLHTGPCVIPHKYTFSGAHGDVTSHIIMSLSQTINGGSVHTARLGDSAFQLRCV